jgi:hypothetical protein
MITALIGLYDDSHGWRQRDLAGSEEGSMIFIGPLNLRDWTR